MTNFTQIVQLHAKLYPQMQAQDAVKLAYQSEFGGGHLIQDVASYERFLVQEMANTTPQNNASLWQPIGADIVRLQLCACAQHGITAQQILPWFCQSASQVQGSKQRFEQKLELLQMLAQNGVFAAFDAQQLHAYLQGYPAQNYAPVSHTQIYRTAYAPAYRVGLKSLCKQFF